MNWQDKFKSGLGYNDFLQAHGTSDHRDRWRSVYEEAALSDEQIALISGFTRQMNVLCLAGAWCGDCVNQCPIFQLIAESSDKIDLRFIDRDVHPDVQQELSINAGQRVPVAVFLSEDFNECSRYGDRTLSKYREMADARIGAACPTGIGDPDQALIKAVAQEWLNEFERVQLMLRLSSRLRQKHGD